MSKWIEQMFEANATEKGGVVRRSREAVDQLGNIDELIAECRSRGFHLIETGGQVIVICNADGIVLHC